MRRTRATYHYAIRHVHKYQSDIRKEKIADSLLHNRQRNFWSEIKKLKGSKSTNINTVDDCFTASDVATHFADKYNELYSSVSYSKEDMSRIVNKIDELLATESACAQDWRISTNDIDTAVNKLKLDKYDGYRGMMSNHVVHANRDLYVHIAMLFSSMLVHGTVPKEFSLLSITPVPKNKSGNMSDSDNYRAIALSSIFGKLFDLIVLDHYGSILSSSELQFGFKIARSTNSCTMVLKEVVDYYVNNSSTVYCIMLDATKAFDRVEYCKLFEKLIDKALPPVVLRLLLKMYTTSQAFVNWNGVRSDLFHIRNGVRQGGILSPILFCVYIDGLLYRLMSSGVGCYIGKHFLGSLAYADDLSLLAPTPSAMRQLLGICESYAREFSIKFNTNKSKCLIFRRDCKISSVIPSFVIDENPIEVVKQWPHLGHIISSTDGDHPEIMRGRTALIRQINSVICFFNKLDCTTKIKLLKAYCYSFYGCELWSLEDRNIDSICVALRQGLRRVWGLPNNAHCDLLMCLSRCNRLVDDLITRQFRFINSCLKSDCSILNFVAKQGIFTQRMYSSIGRNAIFCCDRLNMNLEHVDFRFKFKYFSFFNVETIRDAAFLNELVLLRDGHLSLTSPGLTREDILLLIVNLCTS
jgi:hypothetical protein